MKRKKISQREAVRTRRELRILREQVREMQDGYVGFSKAVATTIYPDFEAGRVSVGALFGRMLVATISGKSVTIYSVKKPIE